jgi:excisionase family DNA binding protein
MIQFDIVQLLLNFPTMSIPEFDFDNDELLTKPEVLALLKISKATFYRLIKKHDIQVYRVGGKVRVGKKSLQQFLKPFNDE